MTHINLHNVVSSEGTLFSSLMLRTPVKNNVQPMPMQATEFIAVFMVVTYLVVGCVLRPIEPAKQLCTISLENQ